jgi:hypothetical protein
LIQTQVFPPRLEQQGVLIAYDPEPRYRDLCVEIASETPAAASRGYELAMATLQRMGQMDPRIEGMLVFVPAKPPLTDEEKHRGPFPFEERSFFRQAVEALIETCDDGQRQLTDHARSQETLFEFEHSEFPSSATIRARPSLTLCEARIHVSTPTTLAHIWISDMPFLPVGSLPEIC